MPPNITVLQKPSFKRKVKKLHANQKKDLDKAVRTVIQNPEAGQTKMGDLAGIRVLKFTMAKQLALLAYTYEKNTITLLTLGSHENFYRDLKR